MFWSKQNNSRFTAIFILILFSLPLILPLFHQGFFLTDDGEWMVIRFSAFYEALRDGQFPVRFLSRLNHGYGYPVANFLYPGFMYLGVPIHLLGFSFVNTIKVIIAVSMLGSVVFCYLWLKKLFSTIPAAVGALFYGYAPYHLYDLYKRGSVGELLALGIIPFVLWQIEKRSRIGISIGIGFLILSHNTLAVLFIILIAAYMLLDLDAAKKRRELFLLFLQSILLGFGLSAFFWIPAIYDLRYTVFSQIAVSNWSEYFVNTDLIGLQTLLIFSAAILFFLIKRAKVSQHRLTVLFFLVGVGTMFLASSFSEALWSVLPVSFIQFPFRLLSLTILAGAFLTGFVFSHLSKNETVIALVVFVVVIYTSTIPFLRSVSYLDKGDSYYATNPASTTVKNEYMPLWVKLLPITSAEKKVVATTGLINNLHVRPNMISFQLSVDRQSTVTVNTIYFPGWTATNNSTPQQIYHDNPEGVMTLVLPKGVSEVELLFRRTPVRLMSEMLSLGTFLVLCIFSLNQFLGGKKRL